jgi:hypothetical protein
MKYKSLIFTVMLNTYFDKKILAGRSLVACPNLKFRETSAGGLCGLEHCAGKHAIEWKPA